MGIESCVIDLIEGRKRSFFLKNVLYLLSLGYRGIVASRNFLYHSKIFKSYKSPLPVVSVGNLVAGGTGKTPFVQKLISEILKKPGDVAIITRGYRSEAESDSIQASLGQGPRVSVSVCGDEAYWLASHTKASVFVGRDRERNLKKAFDSKAKIAILEDGFQHRQVQRDVDIVLLSAADLFGKGYCLPRGYLRESPKNLQRADWIIVTQLETRFSSEKILEKIRPFSKAPIIGFSSRFELSPAVKGKKVGAFCGIAKPDSFYKALTEVEVVKTLTLQDHCAPSIKELNQFALECQRLGAEYLICTEKDQVKLLDTLFTPIPIEVLKMKLECIWNENVWKEMVHSIQTRI